MVNFNEYFKILNCFETSEFEIENAMDLFNKSPNKNNINIVSFNIHKNIRTDPAQYKELLNGTKYIDFSLYADSDAISNITIEGKNKNKIISVEVIMKKSLTSQFEKIPLEDSLIINMTSITTLPTNVEILPTIKLPFTPIFLRISVKTYIPDPLILKCKGYMVTNPSNKLTLGFMHWH